MAKALPVFLQHLSRKAPEGPVCKPRAAGPLEKVAGVCLEAIATSASNQTKPHVLDSNSLRTQLVAASPHIWRWAQFFIDAYLAAADGDEARAAWAALSAPFPFLHDDMRTADSVTFALKLWLVESQYPAVHAELDAMVGDRVKTWRGFLCGAEGLYRLRGRARSRRVQASVGHCSRFF
jgi:hypothetical protein